MTKLARHKTILELAGNGPLASQEELQRALRRRGFKVGQATLSRDIHELGLVKTTPEGFYPGGDVTQLAILGYDPKKYYTGLAPLEAAGLGVALNPDDVAFRCNLVTFRSDAGGYEVKKLGPHAVVEDYSAGQIDSLEANPTAMVALQGAPPALRDSVPFVFACSDFVAAACARDTTRFPKRAARPT